MQDESGQWLPPRLEYALRHISTAEKTEEKDKPWLPSNGTAMSSVNYCNYILDDCGFIYGPSMDNDLAVSITYTE